MQTMTNLKYFIFVCVLFNIGSNGESSIRNTNKFSKGELSVINKFRNEVKPLLDHDYQISDEFLYPWLKVNNLNMDKAKKMIQKALEWRKLNRIDDIYREVGMHDLRKSLPSNWDCHDKSGAPALIIPFGRWDIRKMMLKGKKDQLTRYVDFQYETIFRKMRQIREMTDKKNVTQNILLIDLAGYNVKQQGCVACLPFFHDLTVHYDLYYPEMASNIILINTPSLFQAVLNYFRPLMVPSTQRILKVYSYDKSEWQKELLKHFLLPELPVSLGGTRKLNL